MKDYLKVNNACYGYRGAFHLSDVSFGISRGIFCGIVGPNGSGKTTLLKGLTGELEIGKSQVFLDEVDLSLVSSKERAKTVAIVTQFMEPIEVTVEEYVIMGRIPYRQRFQFFETEYDFRLAEKYMKMTGVYDLRQKMLSNLSGGEQQLVNIAKALVQEPSFLLLDEPTSHLDISHQVQILNLIHNLTNELGITVLMIIHDLNLASEYCDYLVLMKNGKVFHKGTPEEVLNYENIEKVYDTVVITRENPLSKRPVVFLVSNKVLTNASKNLN